MNMPKNSDFFVHLLAKIKFSQGENSKRSKVAMLMA